MIAAWKRWISGGIGWSVQHAVDAVADPQARVLRFDVHVAGPQIDRLQQDLVDQPHHRGFLGHLREFGIVVDGLIEFDAVVGRRQETVDRFAADAQVVLDPLGDLFAAGQHRHHGQPGGHAQLVQGIQVEGIARGDDQAPIVAADGEERFAMDEARGKVLQQAEVDFGVDQVDELQPHLVGQGPQGRLFAEEPELHGGLVQAHPLGLGSARLLKLPGIQQALCGKAFRRHPLITPPIRVIFAAGGPSTLSPLIASSDKPRQREKVSFFSDANWPVGVKMRGADSRHLKQE